MTAEMPERIWAEHAEAVDGLLMFAAPENGTEYVLASTHQRALLALEEAEKALKDARECVEDWAGYAGDYFREKHDLDGDLARIDAALTLIATAKGEQP